VPTPLPKISGPANSALEAAGIRSLEDAARHSRRDIAALHGMGPKGLRMLEAALEAAGLAFAPAAERRRGR
jgi:hypothetical protein